MYKTCLHQRRRKKMRAIEVGDLVRVPQDAEDDGGARVFEEYSGLITWEPVFKVEDCIEDPCLVKISDSAGGSIYVLEEYVTVLSDDDEREEDTVRQPGHYKGQGGMEAIDVIEAFGLNYRVGNAVKYILRAGKKGSEADAITDLRKA